MNIHYSNILVIFFPILYYILSIYLKQKTIKQDIEKQIINTDIYFQKLNTELQSFIDKISTNVISESIKNIQHCIKTDMEELLKNVEEMQNSISTDITELTTLLTNYESEKEKIYTEKKYINSNFSKNNTDNNSILKIKECNKKLVEFKNKMSEEDSIYYTKYTLADMLYNFDNCSSEYNHTKFCIDTLDTFNKEMNYALKFEKEIKTTFNEVNNELKLMFL